MKKGHPRSIWHSRLGAFRVPALPTLGYAFPDLQISAGHGDCKGAECGRQCWHMDLALKAWHRTPAMVAARFLSDTALTNQGKKAAHMVAVYRQRIGRPLADDVIALVAARSEWRRRAALASPAVAVADLPLAA